MFLSKLALLQFKNHQQKEFSFSKKINCFIGKNGAGKTNVLDSIYYLCLTKSYFGNSDLQNVLFGKDFFRIDGWLNRTAENHAITYKFTGSRKKELLMNDSPVGRLSSFVGEFPVVMIAPADSDLITGGSEERRKLMDSTISQIDPVYLQNLISYNQYLLQRNAALKDFSESGKVDQALLDTYNLQLHILGTRIYESRKILIEKLQPAFNYFYETLSLEREKVSFNYSSQLHEQTLDEMLEKNLKRDLILQRTENGIHKDDIELFIGSNKIKRFGSQGQQKSMVLAMKMAVYQFIRSSKGYAPILLIDDIFDKLDMDRSNALIDLISGEDFGQVFLSDTDKEIIESALQHNSTAYEIFTI